MLLHDVALYGGFVAFILLRVWLRDRSQLQALNADHARTVATLNQALDQAKSQMQSRSAMPRSVAMPRRFESSVSLSQLGISYQMSTPASSAACK